MNECIFCKIIAGDLPCEKAYEDSHVLAFLDITPVNPGHTLVVPKMHYPDLIHTPSDILAHLIAAVQKVGNAIINSSLAQGFNVGLNNGASAGQVVFHTHFHVMPRAVTDGHALWRGKKYEQGEAERIAHKLKSAL